MLSPPPTTHPSIGSLPGGESMLGVHMLSPPGEPLREGRLLAAAKAWHPAIAGHQSGRPMRRRMRPLQSGGEKMESNEHRFKHVGLSSDDAVIFCAMDNGKTYAMPLPALEQAEDWDLKAKPKAVGIVHDGYAAFVEFDTGVKIDFPSDFVLHVCEPSYAWFKDKVRAVSGVGGRIREIREARGLTLDALAAKCGIAKPNLSRLENDKVTPTFATINSIAAALHTHPALLVSVEKPEHAWTWTLQKFVETLSGAQAMLDLRSVWIGGQWEAFQLQRIEHETERLYPHRNLVAGEAFFGLAV